MQTISIGEVLNEIKKPYTENGANIFAIAYWTSEGDLKTIPRAQRFVKSANPGQASEKTSFKYNLKEKENILLFDVDTNEHRACKIYRIHSFNNQKVIH